MTRDEAIKKLDGIEYTGTSEGYWIDVLVALGILKLDEPKDDAWDKLTKSMERVGYHQHGNFILDLSTALKSSNLKIVDK